MAKASLQQTEIYSKLTDFLNKELFKGELDECMYVFSRNKNVIGGYFSPDRWTNDDGKSIPEIAINANLMVDGDLQYLLTVLIHEQAHLWQHLHGKPGRGGYHNREWADKCIEIGLQPFGPDGKDTGDSIDTKLISGGKAEQVIALIVTERADEFVFPWFADPLMVDSGQQPRDPSPEELGKEGNEQAPEEKVRKRAGKRDKYTCPQCGANVWGRADLHILCLDCNRPMVNGN